MPRVLTIRCSACRAEALRNENPVPSPTATTWAFDCTRCGQRNVATIKPDWTVMVFPVGKGKPGHFDNRHVLRPPPKTVERKLTPPKPRPTAGAVLSRVGAC